MLPLNYDKPGTAYSPAHEVDALESLLFLGRCDSVSPYELQPFHMIPSYVCCLHCLRHRLHGHDHGRAHG